jgi:iron complex outermembrane receptor protein
LFFHGINPKFGMLYELTDKDQIFANYSRSWQPPSFDDMVDFDNGPDTSQELTPLQPQSAWTAEVGGAAKTAGSIGNWLFTIPGCATN